MQKDEAERAENIKLAALTLTTLFEKLFADLHENLDSAARYERNGDASTALYGVAHAIDMMDIPYLIREALEIPHDDPNDSK